MFIITLSFTTRITNIDAAGIINIGKLTFLSSAEDCMYTNKVINPFNVDDKKIIMIPCDGATFSVVNNIVPEGFSVTATNPTYGSALVTPANKIEYKNTGGIMDCFYTGGLRDTINYKICAVGCLDAKAIVWLLHSPELILEDSCSIQPILSVKYQHISATYDWLYSSDNGATWENIMLASTNTTIPVSKSGIYKIRMVYNGKTYEMTRGLKIDKKLYWQ